MVQDGSLWFNMVQYVSICFNVLQSGSMDGITKAPLRSLFALVGYDSSCKDGALLWLYNDTNKACVDEESCFVQQPQACVLHGLHVACVVFCAYVAWQLGHSVARPCS